jgi:hypothetical protein
LIGGAELEGIKAVVPLGYQTLVEITAKGFVDFLQLPPKIVPLAFTIDGRNVNLVLFGFERLREAFAVAGLHDAIIKCLDTPIVLKAQTRDARTIEHDERSAPQIVPAFQRLDIQPCELGPLECFQRRAELTADGQAIAVAVPNSINGRTSRGHGSPQIGRLLYCADLDVGS